MSLRVVEVTQRYPPALGGVEQHVEHLVRALRLGGIEAEVATTDLARDRPFARLGANYSDDEPWLRRHRAIRVVPAPHGLGIVAPGLVVDLWTSRADIIHAHAFGYLPSWVGAARRRSRRRGRLVITPHSDPGRDTSGSWTYARLVTWATLRAADRVIAQSQTEVHRLRSLGVRAERIAMIPTPIDLSEFRTSAPRELTDQRAVVLFVGRVYLAQKGLDLLVRALGRIPETIRPDLRIVGEDWGGADELLRLATQLGVLDRVTLTGALSREAVLREYAEADIFVLPSRFDSFPVVLLEAMAAGLPIVATRVGAVPEVVQDGRTGLVAPREDIDGLASALTELLDNPLLRRSFGEAARVAVQAYSWTRLGPRYVQLFAEVGGGP